MQGRESMCLLRTQRCSQRGNSWVAMKTANSWTAFSTSKDQDVSELDMFGRVVASPLHVSCSKNDLSVFPYAQEHKFNHSRLILNWWKCNVLHMKNKSDSTFILKTKQYLYRGEWNYIKQQVRRLIPHETIFFILKTGITSLLHCVKQL